MSSKSLLGKVQAKTATGKAQERCSARGLVDNGNNNRPILSNAHWARLEVISCTVSIYSPPPGIVF